MPEEPAGSSASGGAEEPHVPGGQIRVRIVDASRGTALPARIVFRGVDDTPDPDFGPVHVAAGAGRVVVATSGEASVSVPPGRYEITVSHGPEWNIFLARATVTTESGSFIRASLERAVALTDWTACDLHVHARPSFDSQVSIEDRVAALVAEGIEFAVPSEHNIVGDYSAGVAALPRTARDATQGRGLGWVPGVEITTDDAPLRVGHFNAYPYPPTPGVPNGGPPPFLAPPSEIFRAVRARSRDAIVQVNHPHMNDQNGYFNAMLFDRASARGRHVQWDGSFDALEVWNGYDLGNPAATETTFADWIALLSAGRHVTATASSDSHNVGLHTAGYPRTYARTPGAGDGAPESASVIAALRSGAAFATNGPLVFATIEGHGPGEAVHTRGGAVDLRVRILAAPWVDVRSVELHQPGQPSIVREVAPSSGLERIDTSVTLRPARLPGFVVVVARGERTLDTVLPGIGARPFAFTNPIWITPPGP